MKAHELLSDEFKWTQKAFARDAKGASVSPTHPKAVCWCISGALMKCYGRSQARHNMAYTKVFKALEEGRNPPPIACWNDDSWRTFKEVHDLLVKLDV